MTIDAARGLDERQIATLATGEWIRRAPGAIVSEEHLRLRGRYSRTVRRVPLVHEDGWDQVLIFENRDGVVRGSQSQPLPD